MRRPACLILLLLAISVNTSSYGQNYYPGWTRIGQFSGQIYSIYFLDEIGHHERGYLGAGEQIWRTDDTGATWFRLFNDPYQGNIIDITFKDTNTGWFVTARSQEVYRTTDGGFTWFLMLRNTSLFLGGLYYNKTTKRLFLSASERGSGGGYYSDDEGVTWKQNKLPPFYLGFAFSDDNHGIVTGIDLTDKSYTLGILRTSDGGISWTWDPNSVGGWQPYGVRGTSTFYCLNEGDNKLYRSDDYGETWRLIYSPKPSATGCIKGDPCGNLYMQKTPFADYPSVLMSTDQGVNWQMIYGQPYIQSMDAETETKFYIVGSKLFVGRENGELWRYKTCSIDAVRISPETDNKGMRIISVYPNPTTNEIKVEAESNEISNVEIIIYNGFGREYLHATRTLQEKAILNIPINMLPAGEYNLILKNEYSSVSSKFIKLK